MDPEPNPRTHPAPTVVVVFTGGDPTPPEVGSKIPLGAYVIAADSGLDHALALRRRVNLVVGDFDSVDLAVVERVAASGTRVERHPEAKDETDFELALACAVRTGTERIVVVGGHGGRLDHFLANVLVLATPAYAHITIEAFLGAARVDVVHRELVIEGSPGDLVTLLPAHGEVGGVRTEGLLYPLAGETLLPGSTRGVSNELAEHRARVTVERGVLLVVRPSGRGTHFDASAQRDDPTYPTPNT